MKKRLQIPSGVRDLMPDELKKHTDLAERGIAVFEKNGYERVQTPTMELYDTIVQGMGKGLQDSAYKFLDGAGRLMILRPDMTTPIARMAATMGSTRGKVLKYYYDANVFRVSRGKTGEPSEFRQLGAELIGPSGAKADEEILLLLLEVLNTLHLPPFAIDMGSASVFQSLLTECGVDKGLQSSMSDSLVRLDYVRYNTVIGESKLSRETQKIFMGLPTMRGGGEVLRVAKTIFPRSTRERLVELESTVGAIRKVNSSVAIFFNLSLVKDLDYYTGIIFDVYSDRVGSLLGSGGRYDNLIGRFGGTSPATGFALRVDRLLRQAKRP